VTAQRGLSVAPPLHVVLVDPVPEDQPRLPQQALESLDGVGRRRVVVQRLSTLSTEQDSALRAADVIVVDLSGVIPAPIDALTMVVELSPTTPTLAVVRPRDPDVVSRATLAGAHDVVTLAEDVPSQAEALEAVIADQESRPHPAATSAAAQQRHAASLDVTLAPGGLNQTRPQEFGAAVADYAQQVIGRQQERGLRIGHDSGRALRSLAEELIVLDAAPRDVVEIHLLAVRALTRGKSKSRIQSLQAAAQSTLTELMGHLAGGYRKKMHEQAGSSRPGEDDEFTA